MKVLISGATGVIGHHLIERMVAVQEPVKRLVRSTGLSCSSVMGRLAILEHAKT
jgi:uncharacterized protein YbjT (DUF2867 family)